MPEGVIGHRFFKFLDKLRAFRPGADEAHVPAQHVPELRQFVEVEFPQNPADARHPEIVFLGPHRFVVLGVFDHGPKLMEAKNRLVPADPERRRRDGGRSLGFDFDHQSDERP